MSALADLTLALHGLITREVAHDAPAEYRAEVDALEHADAAERMLAAEDDAERETLLRRWLVLYRL